MYRFYLNIQVNNFFPRAVYTKNNGESDSLISVVIYYLICKYIYGQ